MKIAAKYSHLNGEEFLLVHKPELWSEVRDVIAGIDATACKTKMSEEKTMKGKVLYSSPVMNAKFKQGFEGAGWKERRSKLWVTHDVKALRSVHNLQPDEQKAALEKAGYEPILSYNQTDFVKDRVAVEVQFGKYSFVAHDLFVKLMSFYMTDIIDVGIEVLPMKALEKEMSSGVPYFERDLHNVLRQRTWCSCSPTCIGGNSFLASKYDVLHTQWRLL